MGVIYLMMKMRAILEKRVLESVKWTPEVILAFASYALASLMFYALSPFVPKRDKYKRRMDITNLMHITKLVYMLESISVASMEKSCLLRLGSHTFQSPELDYVLGTAKGLIYLQEGLEPNVVHRDIKSTNILLDKEWNPKVSDCSLAYGEELLDYSCQRNNWVSYSYSKYRCDIFQPQTILEFKRQQGENIIVKDSKCG